MVRVRLAARELQGQRLMARWEGYPYGLPPASCDCEYGDRSDGSGAGGPKSASDDCAEGKCSSCHDECPDDCAPAVEEKPVSARDILGIAPDWTGNKSTQAYMDWVRDRG